MPKKSIIVVGMHRSGTSAIARSLESIGIDLGERLIAGRVENQKGFFEDQRIVNLNEDILYDLNSRWENVFLPEITDAIAQRYYAKAEAIIQSLSTTDSDFGFKDPRVTRLFPFWKKVLLDNGINPIIVMSNRHPGSVAKSLAIRDYYPNNYSIILWLCYQISALGILTQEKGFVVDYDNLMDHPQDQIERMSRLTDNSINPDLAAEFADGFIDNNLRHSTLSENSQQTDPALNELSSTLYAFIKDLSSQNSITMQPGQINQANKLIDDVNGYFEDNKLFISDMDAMGFGLKKRLFNKIFEKQRELAAAESKLDWIEGQAVYKLLGSIKRTLF
jgi:hypothetical protein